jgi:phosphoserine phosphatase
MANLESVSLRHTAANDTVPDGSSVYTAPLTQPLVLDLDRTLLRSDLLMKLAEREACRGRRVVLATPSDDLTARRVLKRFAFIGEVLASNETQHVTGAAKAQRLAELFPQGFIYAGDSKADLAVWQQAQSAVGVNLQPQTAKALARLGKPMLLLNDAKQPVGALMKAARVKQWAKNALTFLPLFLAGMAQHAKFKNR